MAKAKNLWPLAVYASYIGHTQTRRISLWGQDGTLDIITIGRQKMVVNNEKSRRRIKPGLLEKLKFKKPEVSVVEAKGEIIAVPVPKRRFEALPASLLLRPKNERERQALGDLRIAKSYKLAAEWLGLPLARLEEKHPGFVVIAGVQYPLAKEIEEIKYFSDIA